MSLVGDRVEIDGPATGPSTGSGRRGVVVAVRECSSGVTGAHLRWTEVDVRLDNGNLVTREPRQLRKVEVMP